MTLRFNEVSVTKLSFRDYIHPKAFSRFSLRAADGNNLPSAIIGVFCALSIVLLVVATGSTVFCHSKTRAEYCEYGLEVDMTDRVDINRLMVEMRSLKSQSQGFQRPEGLAVKDVADVLPGRASQVKGASEVPSFGDMLEQAVNKVNDVQKASGSMAKAYEMGDPNVDVTDVMVASQKASVSFQSMLQVRNKLIDAYRDVMNMPV